MYKLHKRLFIPPFPLRKLGFLSPFSVQFVESQIERGRKFF